MIGHGIAFLLFAAAVGYWVLERSNDQKKNLKTIGQLVGTTIIVVSFMGVACKIYAITKYAKGGYSCPMKMACPMKGACPSADCPICSQKSSK